MKSLWVLSSATAGQKVSACVSCMCMRGTVGGGGSTELLDILLLARMMTSRQPPLRVSTNALTFIFGKNEIDAMTAVHPHNPYAGLLDASSDADMTLQTLNAIFLLLRTSAHTLTKLEWCVHGCTIALHMCMRA